MNLRKVGSLAVVSFSNLGLSFVTQLYIITVLGTNRETDALFAGMTLPQLLLSILSGSLINVLVPLLVGTEKDRLKREIWGFVIFVTLIFGLITSILSLTATIWGPLIFPGFAGYSKELLIQLTRIQLLGVIFTAVSGVFWAYYYSINKFIITELTQLTAGILSIIALYFLLPKYGVVAAAWVFTGKIFLQVVFLIYFVGFKKPSLKSSIFKTTWLRMKPLLWGSVIYKTDPVIDRFLASMTPPGALSLLFLSQQIFSAGNQIISKTLVIPTLPILTKFIKENQWKSYKSTFWKKFYTLIIVNTILLTIGLVFFKLITPLFSILDYRYNYNLFFKILLLSSFSFIIPSIGQLMANSFYAMGETKKITKLGMVAFLLGIPIKFTLYYYFDIEGLASAISIYYLISFLIIVTEINKRFKLHV
ncbi:MAG: polysaccharide biosynthesis C-terminal domain-containing protein [Sphingobacteriales bacterium]|nr:polysaccharide biosynthesis C-terminal domain-containing protein [Sphingobacteriales bacterium]